MCGSEDADMAIMGVDGFSRKTASTITKFVDENYKDIKKLYRLFDIQQDIKNLESRGNVVFTGFRDEFCEAKIEELGYDIGDNVNRDTVAVVAASLTTGKARKAQEKGIPLFRPTDIDRLMDYLKK